jgi:hypothetical protein
MASAASSARDAQGSCLAGIILDSSKESFMSKDVHVSKKGDGWKVTVGGQEVGEPLRTQKEAIDAAKPLAQREQSELVIHGEDGKIRSKDSYGEDSRSRRDTEH